MSQELKNIQLDLSGPVAHIILNRPEAGNAINVELAKELLTAAIICDTTRSVRSVLLTGAGRFFCVGGDLNYLFASKARLARELREMTAALHAAIARLTRMNAPLVVALNGSAGGAGLGLALIGDVVVASRDARLKFAYPRLGYSADAATTYFLPRLVGLRKAQEIIFCNREIDATEACALGLVTYVVPLAELVERAGAIAMELAKGPLLAYGNLKRLLVSSFSTNLDVQMESEATNLISAAMSNDGNEGLEAFVQKRAPQFIGG
jgi:2-(1,2-epoxy-1,2-dihydrophenyl)acetyl-CoA isomerase